MLNKNNMAALELNCNPYHESDVPSGADHFHQFIDITSDKGKDVYDSKTSLASKIVNVERQVDSIDEKLQLFIEMYQKDRKRFSEEAVIKTPTSKLESVVETPPSYEHPLSKDTGEESLVDITGVSSPDSEGIPLPTNSISRSSTITSMSQEIESFAITDISITKPTSSVFKETNAFNV